jgi:hypothetical protein
MQIPTVDQKLSDLLPSNIQLLYGLVKAGGVIIDKEAQTITLNVPYTYSRADIEFMQYQIEQWKQQYDQQVRSMNPDAYPEIVAPNEFSLFNDTLKIYDQLLQVMI